MEGHQWVPAAEEGGTSEAEAEGAAPVEVGPAVLVAVADEAVAEAAASSPSRFSLRAGPEQQTL